MKENVQFTMYQGNCSVHDVSRKMISSQRIQENDQSGDTYRPDITVPVDWA